MLDLCSPDGQGTGSKYRVPMHGTAHILSQTQDKDKGVFHAENDALLSKSTAFALQTHASQVVGGLQGGHRRPNLLMGVCLHCVETPP